MIFTDIHTHNSLPAENTIYNCGTTYIADRKISAGIHPWSIGDGWESTFAHIAEFAKASNVIAIGECGMDILKSPASPELQEKIFRAHISLSESLKKPLIIHCVKTYDRIIALRKETRPQQPWIIHGFRGKPEQARQLVKAGLYISLGEKFNIDSVIEIPAERLFIESDESALPLEDIYAAIAAAKEVSIEKLAQQTRSNALIFGQF